MTRKSGSLFTGVMGLDMAVAEVFGTELAWACDNDDAAAKVIEHRAGVPNLGDITAADWDQVEPVELLTAGWPCQPWSTAGRRKGIEDERALWPEVARAIRTLRPDVVILENVPAIVAAGELARACADLAACGYRFCWVVLGADEVGACHRRNRCFILAVADTEGLGHERGRRARDGWHGPADRSDVAADPSGVGDPDQPRCGAQPDQPLVAVAGTGGGDRERGAAEGVHELGRAAAELAWGPYEPAIRRWERILGRPAPVPRVVGPRGGLKLNPALPEWMQGFPAGWITDVPGVSMNDALKLAGNSVNKFQAVAALRWMTAQIERTAA